MIAKGQWEYGETYLFLDKSDNSMYFYGNLELIAEVQAGRKGLVCFMLFQVINLLFRNKIIIF